MSKQAEEIYDRAELLAAARLGFGVQPEVMAGALRLANADRATKAQAEAAISTFLRREVTS